MATHFHSPFRPLILITLVCLVNADQDLIETTCKTTKHHDLCVMSLQSDPTSVRADVKGLATIMINVGIANATAAYTYLSSQVLVISANKASGGNVTPMRNVFKLCADKYSSANMSLWFAVQDLSMDNYDYANVQISAAADYPNVCHNAFKRYPGLTYPTELARRENGLESICNVVLAIIDLIPINK